MGPEPMYVKIISHDGHEFIIKRKYAEASETLSQMMRISVPAPGIEPRPQRLHVP
jgi:hypothetical protein